MSLAQIPQSIFPDTSFCKYTIFLKKPWFYPNIIPKELRYAYMIEHIQSKIGIKNKPKLC